MDGDNIAINVDTAAASGTDYHINIDTANPENIDTNILNGYNQYGNETSGNGTYEQHTCTTNINLGGEDPTAYASQAEGTMGSDADLTYTGASPTTHTYTVYNAEGTSTPTSTGTTTTSYNPYEGDESLNIDPMMGLDDHDLIYSHESTVDTSVASGD